ncbi:amidase [Endobacter medicaginis]|uniref:Amidase n=1 Tax=Endobacter medicaginis TaxID=1181271 RepID=A0A850NQ13_9PROT|nr:amidase [Endobacter medicaginis]MCX5475484.1 amidase [Endobacter medicaginis]NVN29285.1 amidase [Endobacter medicaginis]
MNHIDSTGSPADLSARDLHERYRDGSLSPVDVVRSVLDRIEACEPALHATYAISADAALAEARASETRWRGNASLGPLDGVPVTVKENVASKGTPVPLGSAASDLVPAEDDAPPMARLREAGAILVTKTTMPDFGLLAAAPSSFHALTRNPWDLSRTPGGSSSGAAAAAAAGYGPLHVGTDIGGSIRIPAGFCGVFGLKPSWGRVPHLNPYFLRVTGPITREVADAAKMMEVLSLPDERDYMSLPYQPLPWSDLAPTDLRGLRLALLLDAGSDLAVDPEVVAAVSGAARILEAQGATIVPVDNWVEDEMRQGFSTFMHIRAAADLEELRPEQQQKLHPIIREAIARQPEIDAKALHRAQRSVLAMKQRTTQVSAGFDFVLSPVSPGPAFAAELWCADPEIGIVSDTVFTSVHNVSGQPAASITCGYTKAGLPIGLQIAGRRFDDVGVLRLSRAWELLRPEPRAWPTQQVIRSAAMT